MGRIKVVTNVTLDGVMQSPARPEEDPRGGFTHGGWAAPYAAMQQAEAGEAFADMGGLLFGRWTYECSHDYGPSQIESPFAAFLNDIPKYVVSTTLSESLPWDNSTLIRTDIATTLETLKEGRVQDLVVFGSGVLVHSLVRWNVVDELTLLIHPLVLGSGQRLFPDGGASASLSLRHARTTDNGVVIATYRPGTMAGT